jgi:hypothetical protein
MIGIPLRETFAGRFAAALQMRRGTLQNWSSLVTLTVHCTFCDHVVHVADRCSGTALSCDECGSPIELPAGTPVEKNDAAGAAGNIETGVAATQISTVPAPPVDVIRQAPGSAAPAGETPHCIPGFERSGQTGSGTHGLADAWWLFASGAAGLVFLLTGIGIAVAVSRSGRSERPAAIALAPDTSSADPSSSGSRPAANAGSIERRNVDPDTGSHGTASRRTTGQTPDGAVLPPSRSTANVRSDQMAEVKLMLWNVAVDGPAESISFPPDHAVRIPIPPNSGADVLLPDVRSLFVAVGSNHAARELREIWNLGTNRRVGALGDVRITAMKTALSSGGDYLAAVPLAAVTNIPVYDVKGGKLLIEIPYDANGFARAIAFTGTGRLVAVSGKNECTVWAIPSGKAARLIDLSRNLESDSIALSPGGRYLTFVDGELRSRRVRTFDLESGAAAGELALEGLDHGAHTCRALRYSPDGRELAGLFDAGSKWVLLCWDVKSGTLISDFEFDVNAESFGMRQELRLQWFPDRSRWLLFGHFLFGRSARRVVREIGREQLGQSGPCYVLDDRRVLQVHNDVGNRSLVSVPLEEEVPADRVNDQPVSPSVLPAGAGAGIGR